MSKIRNISVFKSLEKQGSNKNYNNPNIYPVGETGLPTHSWKIKKHWFNSAFCSIFASSKMVNQIVTQVKNLIVNTPSCLPTTQCICVQVKDYFVKNNPFSCHHYHINKTKETCKAIWYFFGLKNTTLMPNLPITHTYQNSKSGRMQQINVDTIKLFEHEKSHLKSICVDT